MRPSPLSEKNCTGSVTAEVSGYVCCPEKKNKIQLNRIQDSSIMNISRQQHEEEVPNNILNEFKKYSLDFGELFDLISQN